MMHSSQLIANEFLEKARDDGNVLTPMQLLKLVYIAHGWMLGLYGVPLTRDRIEAWKYGPVIPELYHTIKDFGTGPVLLNLSYNQDNNSLVPVEKNLIEQVYKIYGRHSGIALSNLTHQAGTPWERVYMEGLSNIPIPNDIIEEHYKSLSQGDN